MTAPSETTLDAWAYDGPRCDLCHGPTPSPEAKNRMCDDCLDNVRHVESSRWADRHGYLEEDV